MAVIHAPESNYAKEIVKWEAHPTAAGPGLRPYIKRDFPAWFYRATRVDGQLGIAETELADSDVRAAALLLRGFSETPDKAFAAVEATERELAKLAANRAYGEQRMSPAARAEAAAAEADSSGHLASVPEQPIRRRQRRQTKTDEPLTGGA